MINIKTRKEIEKRLDDIVEKSRKLIHDTKIYEKNSKMEESQMRNLLNFAISTDSIKALELFIQYQIGRDTKKTSWRYNDFGRKIINELNSLQNQANEIAKLTNDNPKQIWIELIRNYIGYSNQYFVFKVKTERKEE
jgi:hypothetical protein